MFIEKFVISKTSYVLLFVLISLRYFSFYHLQGLRNVEWSKITPPSYFITVQYFNAKEPIKASSHDYIKLVKKWDGEHKWAKKQDNNIKHLPIVSPFLQRLPRGHSCSRREDKFMKTFRVRTRRLWGWTLVGWMGKRSVLNRRQQNNACPSHMFTDNAESHTAECIALCFTETHCTQLLQEQ
jgi:hypothetical protein